MAINLDKIKNRLSAMTQKTSKTNALWKPKPGSQVVRIVPYKFDQENPFIELFFHYGLNNKTYLSPISFGKDDPIAEMADKLKSTGDKEDYEMSRNFQPKLRIYAPVIVRGEEDEGVKFWGFGKQVYTELLGIISDPDYGDITDMKNGRDITVEFKTAKETGKQFPETSIRVKPKETPAVETKEHVALLKDQVEITEIYREYSYEELKDVLENWLNDGDASEEQSQSDNSSSDSSSDSSDEKKEESSSKKLESADDVEAEFDNLFDD